MNPTERRRKKRQRQQSRAAEQERHGVTVASVQVQESAASLNPENITGLGEPSARGESGLTHKEDRLLTDRAIRNGWVPGPFPTDVPVERLKEMDADPQATLQEKAAASVAKGLESCDVKRVSRAELTTVAMVRTNEQSRLRLGGGIQTNIQNNINLGGAVTVQDVLQAIVKSTACQEAITEHEQQLVDADFI